jgi:uncharacterized protein YbbC (DUF1343 family)
VVTPIEFVPDASKFAGETCGGIHLQVVDREAFHPVAAGLTLAEALVAVGGEAFEVSKVVERLAAPREEAGRAALDWSPGAPLDAWWQQVQPHLLYPR